MTTLTAMPKYEAYKDSGVEYAGLIPSSWLLLPIRAIFEERNEKNLGPKTDFILSVTKDRGVIPYDEKGAVGNNKSEDIERYKLVHINDLVVNKMNIVIGSLGLSKYFGALSQVYIVLRPKNKHFNIKYYSYLFSDETFYKSMIKYCTGIMELRESLNKNEFKKINLPYPTEVEQTAIANFLDEKTAKIDEAIAIKEKQIELLKERKQIIIQQAVTQGLDPTVPMKDSGVEWIGMIPAHWIVGKIGHYARVYNGSTPSREIKRYWDNGSIPWLSSGKVNDYIVNEPSELISESALKECSLRMFPKGSIIIGIVGQGKTRGTSAQLNIDATINQNVAGIIPGGKLDSDFLHLFLINSYLEIRSLAQGSNQEALNANLVSSFKILIPTLEEQKNIVLYANKELKKVDSVIEIQINQIDTLKEYKTTLINSAVTGKIKVV